MANLSQPDEIRIEKLRQWLEGRGIDVVQVGHELTMPSPFKEAAKKQTDDKRRLSVTIDLENGLPTLRWQCWWSRGRTGKAFGGRSTYALSKVTKVSQQDISTLLDLHYDEKVEQAETQVDKVIALLTQPIREAESRRVFQEQIKTQKQDAVPHLLPPCILSLWEGNPLTAGPESMVEERGIFKDVGYQYGLGWDYDDQAIFLPWVDQSMTCRTFQHWNGSKYRFPRDETGRMTKSDAVFGLHLWKPGRPFILAEGCFTAMSVCGCALGGSSISEKQIELIKACGPDTIITAFDQDHSGFDGTVSICKRLAYALGCRMIPTFSPEGNDWNDVLKRRGFQATMQAFAERIRSAMTQTVTGAIVSQYRGGQ